MDQQSHQDRGLLDNLKPRTAFKAGLLAGLVVMFVIGFFVLLFIVLNDGKVGKTTKNNNTGTVTNPTVPTDNAAADISIQAPDPDNDWIRGDEDAPIQIVEFSDIDCPFCQRFHATMQQIVDEYDGDVNWTYRHFPLTQLHPEANQKAMSAECVGEQGGNDAFWAYLDKDFAERPKMAQVPDVVASLGLDVNKFNECLSSNKYQTKITDQTNQATAAGGRGTPYSVILAGDQKIPINGALPYETVKAQIDSLLN